MRFSEYFERATSPVISFEVFPPRSEKGEAVLDETLPRLVALRPAYMTVTYGALGSTRDKTVEIAARIRKHFRMETACHLTCVGCTVAEIDAILDRIESEGIENIVALRGDPPKGEVEFVPPEGGFSHANELVAHIRAHRGFGIAVAGYPEKHVEAVDFATDLRYLKQKVEAGGDVVITQLFYDNEDFYRFETKVRESGIRAPLVPGLLPIQSYKQIRKIASLCGAKIPEALRERLEAVEEDRDRVAAVGAEWALAQAKALLEHGVPGIHFYVLNRADHMERIMGELREAGLVGG